MNEVENSEGQGTLTLALSWQEGAAGRTFKATVPLTGLCLDGGRGDVRFRVLQDLRVCGRRRGLRVKLLECENEAAEMALVGDGAPLLLCFSVRVPESPETGTNKLIAALGRVGSYDVTLGTDSRRYASKETRELEDSPLSLSNAEGQPVECRWVELPS